MRFFRTNKLFFGAAALLCVALAACQQPTQQQPEAVTNTNTTTTIANVNSSNSTSVSSTTETTSSGAVIETKEPEKYTATMSITAAPSGQQAQTLPDIKIARNGTDRRYSMDTRIPTVGEVIFLDKADKRYLILPARKQYLELTSEMTGVEMPRSLTPGQLVSQLGRQQGVERVGEETLNGRQTTKYRYAAKTNTGTQAGQVATDSFIYIDKETGLPLRIEGFGQATGSVQGMNGGKATVEMRNLTTEVNAADFEIPQGYAKLTPEQVQQQTKVIIAGIQFFLNAFNAQQGGGGTMPLMSATPATTSASPATTTP